MKLRSKLCLSYLAVGLIPLLVIGLYMHIYLREQKFHSISEFFIAQLTQIDLTLSSFLQEVEYDVASLVNNKLVRTRADEEFTNFLQADEQTFTYKIGDAEQQIIDIFVNYKDHHAYVNSVYMGRANGAFVRSHPRARPTQYDPRDRPWYQLAVSQPDRVMRTAPYKSVTTDDINIGIAKALVDERNAVFGVVGADITLGELTTLVSHLQTGREGYIMLVDEQGVILSNPVPERRFQQYNKVGLEEFQTVMTNDRGHITFQDVSQPYYAFFYTSPQLHWKICAIMPVTEIEREIVWFSNTMIWVVMVTLLAGGIQGYYLARRITIPVNALIQGIRRLSAQIKKQQAFEKIQPATKDEIATLAEVFNAMGEELFAAHHELNNYSKNLEAIVARRTQELSHSNTQLVAEIAERRRAQAAADAANRAKSDFLASMSHELRTPLNGILGYTQILARDLALTPKQQEAIAVIHRSGEHLLRLINEVLDLAKIEARKMTLEPCDFHLPECLQSVAAMASVRAEQKGLTLKPAARRAGKRTSGSSCWILTISNR